MTKGAYAEDRKSLVAYDLLKLTKVRKNHLNSSVARNEIKAVTNKYYSKESKPRQIDY